MSAPIDYLMLKIDAGALWKRSYIHFVLLGPIPVLGNQVNDCSKFRAKKKKNIRDFCINNSKKTPTYSIAQRRYLALSCDKSFCHSNKEGICEDQLVGECFKFVQQQPHHC